jgi:hypothetical protein
MNKRLIICAAVFWAGIFGLWAGDFAVVPAHRYDPANLAYDVFFAALAAVSAVLFVRSAVRKFFGK